MKTTNEFESCAQRLKALADGDRLRIVAFLFGGPRNVGQVAEALDEDIVKVSHHLGVLKRAGLVQAAKHGRFVTYSLEPEVTARNKGPQPTAIDLGCCKLDLAGRSTS
ncbi:MAG TPA: metalloregulator ArsR/SmtB family transcription factor [Pirellulales bacterium]|nr:metalloregulator ArsR/SmtB family transcription factor [Pirellulales bacterium]